MPSNSDKPETGKKPKASIDILGSLGDNKPKSNKSEPDVDALTKIGLESGYFKPEQVKNKPAPEKQAEPEKLKTKPEPPKKEAQKKPTAKPKVKKADKSEPQEEIVLKRTRAPQTEKMVQFNQRVSVKTAQGLYDYAEKHRLTMGDTMEQAFFALMEAEKNTK